MIHFKQGYRADKKSCPSNI